MTLRSRRREDALARDLANFLFKRATFSSEKRTYTTVDSVVRLAASQLKGQIGDNLEVYPICAERVVRLAAQYYAELCHSAEESSDNSNSPTPPTCMENVNSCPDQAFLQHNRQQECSSFSLFDYLDQQAVRSNMAESASITAHQIIDEYETSDVGELTVALFENMREIDFVDQFSMDDNFPEFGQCDSLDDQGKKPQSIIKYMVDIMREGILNCSHFPLSSITNEAAVKDDFAGLFTIDQETITNRFIAVHWKYFSFAMNNSKSFAYPATQQEFCSLMMKNLSLALKAISLSQCMVHEHACDSNVPASSNCKEPFSRNYYVKRKDLFPVGHRSVMMKLVKVLTCMLKTLCGFPSLNLFVPANSMKEILINLLSLYGHLPEKRSSTFAIHPAHLVALEAPEAGWFSVWAKHLSSQDLVTITHSTGLFRKISRIIEASSLGQSIYPLSVFDTNNEANIMTGENDCSTEIHCLKQALFINLLSILRVMIAGTSPLSVTSYQDTSDFTDRNIACLSSISSRSCGVIDPCNREARQSIPPAPGRYTGYECLNLDETFQMVEPFLASLKMVSTCEETKVSAVIANICVDAIEAAIMASSSSVASSLALLPKIINSMIHFCKKHEEHSGYSIAFLELFRGLCYRIMSHDPWHSAGADGARHKVIMKIMINFDRILSISVQAGTSCDSCAT